MKGSISRMSDECRKDVRWKMEDGRRFRWKKEDGRGKSIATAFVIIRSIPISICYSSFSFLHLATNIFTSSSQSL